MSARILFLGLAAAIVLQAASCARIPAVDGLPASAAAAPPPALLPLDDLLAQATAATATAARAQTLAARAARLRHRALLMRGPVHDPATRARLAEAIRLGRA